jgi:uridine kinase
VSHGRVAIGQNVAVHAKVIVLAGPSGSGKSRLCTRLGLPFVNLDDFYRDGTDPDLPRRTIGPGHDIVDWDDPAAWLRDEAVDALEKVCRDGRADLPVYDIAHDGRVGHRELVVGDAGYVVAEGIFAQEVVAGLRERGVLADAVCVRNHRLVTFWRRLIRDLRERRKPPLVLLRRGWLLMRAEPDVVAHAVSCHCAAMTPDEAYARLSGLVSHSAQRSE